jgi:hypothetical protein
MKLHTNKRSKKGTNTWCKRIWRKYSWGVFARWISRQWASLIRLNRQMLTLIWWDSWNSRLIQLCSWDKCPNKFLRKIILCNKTNTRCLKSRKWVWLITLFTKFLMTLIKCKTQLQRDLKFPSLYPRPGTEISYLQITSWNNRHFSESSSSSWIWHSKENKCSNNKWFLHSKWMPTQGKLTPKILLGSLHQS